MKVKILRYILLLIVMAGSCPAGWAQQADTLHSTQAKEKTKPLVITRDTVGAKHAVRRLAVTDTLKKAIVPLPGAKNSRTGIKEKAFTNAAPLNYEQFLRRLLSMNHFFTNQSDPIQDFDSVRPPQQGHELLFYISFGILLLLAIMRLAFYKYFSDMFRAFFNPVLSQRQLKEQLSQTPFPSFLLNIFFAIAGGFYFFLILKHYNYIVSYNPLYLITAFILLVGIVYFFKYLFLRLAGWLFGSSALIDGYIFVIYLINKVMGIALLPFIIIMAFCPPEIATISLYAAFSLMLLLITYRYIRAYGLIKNYIYFSKFHFFLYLCAFEIAPILIIGRLVLIWLNGSGG